MSEKPLIIYHDNCVDGFASAFAAWLALGDTAEYFPCNYGKYKVYVDEEELCFVLDYNGRTTTLDGRNIYFLDFSMSLTHLNNIAGVVDTIEIHDHHISAYKDLFEKRDELKKNIYLNFHMEKAGCWLAWERFRPGYLRPQFIHLIGLRDLWKHKDTDLEHSAECLNLYLNSEEFDFEKWQHYMATFSNVLVHAEGMMKFFNNQVRIAKRQAINKQISYIADSVSGTEKYHVKIVNAPYFMASELGNQLAKECDFAAVWSHANDGAVFVSLRSDRDRGVDVSRIAKWYNGGGHKNAAGCKFTSLDHFMNTFNLRG